VEFCWVGLARFGVRLGQACAQLTHAWVKFSQVAQRCFLTAPSVCRRPNCPLTRRVKQRMGQIVRGPDCHSQCLDPLLRGRTERFGCGRTVRPLWGRIVSIWKHLWGESLQCRMVRVGWCGSECHSVQLGVAQSSRYRQSLAARVIKQVFIQGKIYTSVVTEALKCRHLRLPSNRLYSVLFLSRGEEIKKHRIFAGWGRGYGRKEINNCFETKYCKCVPCMYVHLDINPNVEFCFEISNS
jgi:hypothetical protein